MKSSFTLSNLLSQHSGECRRMLSFSYASSPETKLPSFSYTSSHSVRSRESLSISNALKDRNLNVNALKPSQIGNCRQKRHSGVQLSVLSLYRSFLRLALQKEDPKSSLKLKECIRREFRLNMHIGRREFARIESLIHRGTRRLESLKKSSSSESFRVYIPKRRL